MSDIEAAKAAAREKIKEMGLSTPAFDVAFGDAVAVPATGKFYVVDGVVRLVEESDWQDYADGSECYTIWVEKRDDDV